jgi:UDP-N-acetylmuramoylalanine--D-glutamate ligase
MSALLHQDPKPNVQQIISSGGEVAVIGLGKSGISASLLLLRHGSKVYASDAAKLDDTAVSAIQALRSKGAVVDTGGHDIERIKRAALVVLSPGVPPTAPPVRAARDVGVSVISEVELALQFMPKARYIAVTGTNGKTTTTALVAHLLSALGHNTVAAGNIGTPLTEIALAEQQPDWIALELSSFQLHDTPSVNPAVGILTNLTPDHLDRYSSVDEYYGDKLNLFANAIPSSRWVFNADDHTSLALTGGVAGEHAYFTVFPGEEGVRSDAYYARASNYLVVLGEPLLPRIELTLIGTHNVANALAASLAVMLADQTHRTAEARHRIADALRTFRALPHRLELVGTWNDIQWINDSKATNVDSTYVAITGMTHPTILLLGGRHKGEPYTRLASAIRDHVKHVIAYGEAAELIEQDLREIVPVTRLGTNFSEVLQEARALAQSGDAILLSPACSSYDMFKNYEDRGDQFRTLAKRYA